MTCLLIVESNTPELVAAAIARGETGLATLFANAMRRIDPELEIREVAPYEGASMDLEGVDGIIFTGSGVDWPVMADPSKPLYQAMETALQSGLPVHGSCNGMQLAAHVLGGRIGLSDKGPEDGLAVGIELTEAGRSHPMLAGRADGFAVPCIHSDEVQELPAGAVLLARNAHCGVQAYEYAVNGVDFWGCQYHPEYTASFVADVLERIGRTSQQTRDDLRVAETDPAAATRLGTTPNAQADDVRMLELANWLAHVERQKAARA